MDAERRQAAQNASPHRDPLGLCDPNSLASRLIRCKADELGRRGGFSRSDVPDLRQELLLHLLQRAAAFNPHRAKAATFLSRVLNNKAASILRARSARKRDFRRCRLSLSPQGDLSHHRVAERAVAPEMDRADLAIDLSMSERTMPPDLAELARELRVHSERGAGGRLGRSRRQVRAGIAEIRERFDKAGIDGYLPVMADQ